MQNKNVRVYFELVGTWNIVIGANKLKRVRLLVDDNANNNIL